jgi:hypothetical protein
MAPHLEAMKLIPSERLQQMIAAIDDGINRSDPEQAMQTLRDAASVSGFIAQGSRCYFNAS